MMKKINLPRSNKFKKITKELSLNIKQIAIVVALLTFFLPINKQALADKKIKSGKKQATLILSDGSKIILNTKSDTIVSSEKTGIRIKIDSTGINYITTDNAKELKYSQSKPVKKK
jgi:ferric-dicitrate binding protein FerR (iron transport regulator)